MILVVANTNAHGGYNIGLPPPMIIFQKKLGGCNKAQIFLTSEVPPSPVQPVCMYSLEIQFEVISSNNAFICTLVG
jgi:hypothetical protein